MYICIRDHIYVFYIRAGEKMVQSVILDVRHPSSPCHAYVLRMTPLRHSGWYFRCEMTPLLIVPTSPPKIEER